MDREAGPIENVRTKQQSRVCLYGLGKKPVDRIHRELICW